MIDSLKKIDRKFLIIFGGIVGLLILFVLVAIIFKLLSGPGKNYESLERRLIQATEKYMYNEETPELHEGEQRRVDAEVLISQDYLKELHKYVEDETCSAYVDVANNSGLLNFLPYIQCAEYMTKTIAAQVIEDNIVINDLEPFKSGAYEEDGEYIFKGRNPNNFVLFGDTMWRIIKIDANGTLRLVKVSPERSVAWDTKFNDTESQKTGKNIFGDNAYAHSDFRYRLTDSYNGFRDVNKGRIVPHDVCVGKRAFEDYTMDLSIDCAEVLYGEYISTVNTVETAQAGTLDPACRDISSGGCGNYNYFENFFGRAWTTIGVVDNTHEVYTVSSASASKDRANKRHAFYWVIHISGAELFQSGTGTEEDPYFLG